MKNVPLTSSMGWSRKLQEV